MLLTMVVLMNVENLMLFIDDFDDYVNYDNDLWL